MSVIITDELLKNSKLSEEEFRLELAIFLFQKEILTLGKASEFAKVHQFQMQKELTKRKIPMHYDYPEFQEDLAMVKEMGDSRDNN